MDAFIQNSDTDGIYKRFDKRRDTIDTVAVGVGLEHYKDFGREYFGADGIHVPAELA